ncbi:hypothetical protein E2C01_009534 [Portunus trituberculatus]|uniref:Uncharacterized protein n=1 Tax=Portunus trituberculatus TaxID=210409 RepID=A0A5B7D627_PORTR|nr:hypothetical protein [Portunus trituberculatus]
MGRAASHPRPADTFATRAAKQNSTLLGYVSQHVPVSMYILMGSVYTYSVICEPTGRFVAGEAAAGRGISRDTRRHHCGARVAGGRAEGLKGRIAAGIVGVIGKIVALSGPRLLITDDPEGKCGNWCCIPMDTAC